MNEAERRELDELKARQADLLAQLARLGHRLDAFERRVTAPQPAPIPEPPKPQPVFHQPAPPPPRPASPPPIPPIIPPRAQPQPVFEQLRTAAAKAVPQTPAPPAPEPVFAQAHAPIAEPIAPPPAPEPPKKGSFEMRLGTYWLPIIGIVLLLTGLAFFGSYAYQNFIPRIGPGGKVAMLYLLSGTLLALGAWLPRKQESLKNYAQVLQAGGLAAVYFTTYAAYHFPNLQVIPYALLDGLLLLGWAGFMIWLADRKRSEVLALFSVLLAYYTSVITHVGLFTLYSNLILTAAAVFFLVRHRWATLSFASLVATYVSYAFWRFFHAGEWHWAAPSEGLWTGNYFLMGYWLLFSAAVFLSKHESFIGERRASFLSLNNAAFFTCFLLTMLEVHQHGFWKFSLLYGAVLIGLSILARFLLIKDKLAGNAYLTQGLLLVTLGFLTHLTGLKLSLVLAVESVILVSLGQMLRSRVMQTGSVITGGLATICAIATMGRLDRNGLICGIAVGAMMLWNAFYLRRKTTFEQSASHARTLFYTTTALVVWLVATWQNTNPEWRGVVLACEAIVFLAAARPMGNGVIWLGAFIFACICVAWEGTTLGEQLFSFELSRRVGVLQGVLIGILMLGGALWEQRIIPAEKAQSFRLPVSFFTAAALIAGLLTTFTFTPREFLAPLLAIEALVFTAAFYPLQLKELAAFGQFFLICAQALWLYDATVDHISRPWWNPVLVIAASLVLAAWWQRQKSLALTQPVATLIQALYALAVVGLLFYWLEPQFTAPTWLAFSSVLAILLTVYGTANRYWLLVASGQVFIIISGWQFCVQLWNGEPLWYFPLVPIAALCALSFSALKWFEKRPDASAQVRDPILGLGLIYRVLALLMSLWWVHKYIPARENFWVLTLLGLGLFLLSGWRRNQEVLIFSAAFTLMGLIKFAVPLDNTPTVSWPNLLAIFVLLGQQQFAKRVSDRYQLPAEIHATVIVAGSLCLWLLVSRWILQQTAGFYLTVGWSGVALVLFIAGMATRERVYRWLGLAVLACALGRVVIFDVWKLETLYRICTFMALGVVLLILGFIYNRYQEKIKEWL